MKSAKLLIFTLACFLAAFSQVSAQEMTGNDPDKNPVGANMQESYSDEYIPPPPAFSVFMGTTELKEGATINMGSVSEGGKKEVTLTVKNTANHSFYVFSHDISYEEYFSESDDLYQNLVEPGKTVSMTVRFTPGQGVFDPGDPDKKIDLSYGFVIRGANYQEGDFFPGWEPVNLNLRVEASIVPESAPEIAVLNGTQNLNDGGSMAFGNVNRGSDKMINLMIKNTGSANLTGIKPAFAGGNAGDYAVVAAPAAFLAPNASTTIGIRFTPSAQGNRPTSLRIASNDADENPFDLSLSGSGVNIPEITVLRGDNNLDDGDSVSFGDVNRGSGKTINLTIINTGTAELAGITTSFAVVSGEYSVVKTPATTLAPNAATSIGIRFTPSGSGVRPDFLRIASNDADENPFVIRLSGTGLDFPEIAVLNGKADLGDGGSISFGSVTRSSGKTITLKIRNTGTANLTGIAVSVSGGNASDFTIVATPLVNLATTLAPNETVLFSIRFKPSAQGSRTTSLRIASNDPDENPFDIKLSGSGVNVPEVAVLQGKKNLVDGKAELSFDPVIAGSTKTITLTIKNTGTAKLSRIAASLKGGQVEQFVIAGKPAANLAPGKTATVKITFKPSGKGNRATTLRIASNDADENPFDIKLSGNATKASAVRALSVGSNTGTLTNSRTKTLTSSRTKDGVSYLVLTVEKTGFPASSPLVEVSSDLVHWFSGPAYTETLIDNATMLKVRDLTPQARAKRHIRVRWLLR